MGLFFTVLWKYSDDQQHMTGNKSFETFVVSFLPAHLKIAVLHVSCHVCTLECGIIQIMQINSLRGFIQIHQGLDHLL